MSITLPDWAEEAKSWGIQEVLIYVKPSRGRESFTWVLLSDIDGRVTLDDGEERILRKIGPSVGEEKTEAEAVLSAFSEMLKITPKSFPINLYSNSETFLNNLNDMRSAFPNIDPQPVHYANQTRMYVVAKEEYKNANPVVVRDIDIAVDGSWGRYHKMGGWAFLTSEGKWKSGTVTARSSLSVELLAIEEALKYARTVEKGTITIITDSATSLNQISGKKELKGEVQQNISRIRALLTQLSVQVKFVWVKSHSGNPLNEGADSLAVAQRRNKENNLPVSQFREVAERIASEHVEVFHSGGLVEPSVGIVKKKI